MSWGYRGRHRPPGPPLITRVLWAAVLACFALALLVGLPFVLGRGAPAQGETTPGPVPVETTPPVDIAEEIARAIEPDYAARLTPTDEPDTTPTSSSSRASATTTAPSEVAPTPSMTIPPTPTRKARPSSEPAVTDSSRTRAKRASRCRAADKDAAGVARFGGVRAHVVAAGVLIRCQFGIQTVFGIGWRAEKSEHPKGLALDFMTDERTGDALSACVLKNQRALNVHYVIWRQRINFGSGFKLMEDRGRGLSPREAATKNHFDHVHVSFDSAGSKPASIRC